MLKYIYDNLFLILSFTLIIILISISINNPFFWDTVQLGSKHANYYLSTNFSNLLLPENIDSGHIPAFGFYLSLIWKIFGRDLTISHLAMLPFILGILWQLFQLTSKLFKKKEVGLITFLILIDPTLLSQITLISPDIPLTFFFLLGLNSVIKNRKAMLTISILLLFLISMRGMMVSLCILLIDIYYNTSLVGSFKNKLFILVKRSKIYLPALFIFIAYNLYHYIVKGWFGFHEESAWAECFETVDLKGFFYNIAILGWRILDFGRIGIWLVFLVLFLNYKQEIVKDTKIHLPLFIFISLLIFLPLNMLWAKNLLAHRYLIPIYLSFALLCAKVLFSPYVRKKLRSILIIIWVTAISTGNLWVYPTKIAQGWDSTLAHLPYYELRDKAIIYLDDLEINFNDVCSFFPNTATIDEIDLKKDYRRFKPFNGEDKYVIYSNIYNVNDKIYDRIIENYDMMKEFKDRSICVNIYKKRN